MPRSIFELEPWDYVNSVHTTSSMIHLLPEPKPPLFYSSELCWVCLWEIASEKTGAGLPNGKDRYKKGSWVRPQRNTAFCECSVWSCNCSFLSPPFSVFALFSPFCPPLLQVFSALINANLCSLAGVKPAGRGPLPWLPAVRVGRGVVVGGWGEGDLDRHLI